MKKNNVLNWRLNESMKDIVVKMKKQPKFYKASVKYGNGANFILKVEKHDKGIFELFKNVNLTFDMLARSMKFYSSYNKDMQDKFNSSVRDLYILDRILNYIITDIGDVYMERDFKIFKHLKLAKVVIV
jgi:hypothetical protein